MGTSVARKTDTDVRVARNKKNCWAVVENHSGREVLASSARENIVVHVAGRNAAKC